MTIESPKLHSEGSEEFEKIPQVDALAIIGYSIEHDKTRGFVPTRLIQKMDESKKRTGVRDRILSSDDDLAYVGGGNAVALAAAEMYDALVKRGVPPKAVSVVQGRPLYLENAPPEVNEGAVMLEAFKRRTHGHPESVVILGAARNTEGELEEHLKMCAARGYNSIGFVLLDLRIERAQALLDKLKAEHQEFASLKTPLISAETLLRERYKDNPQRLRQLENMLGVFAKSPAYTKTVTDEQGGTTAIRGGTYRGKGNY